MPSTPVNLGLWLSASEFGWEHLSNYEHKCNFHGWHTDWDACFAIHIYKIDVLCDY